MHLLVVGANGLLGSNVVHHGIQRGWTLCGTYHSECPDFEIPMSTFDLQTPDQFSTILKKYDPDAVVNCAAMTSVDNCESDPELAHILNGKAPESLAADCRQRNIEFVHISTDYVFSGSTREPYQESDRPNPQQVYGESKLAGEQAVMSTLPTALVARLAFVWGIHRSRDMLSGFPAWVREHLREGESVPLFIDQWVTPTRAGHAAETILDLLAEHHSDLVHVASSSCVSPYEFGQLIANRLNESKGPLMKESLCSVERAAARPVYSCLDVQKVESLSNRPQPTIEDDLDAINLDLSSDQI